MKTMLRHAACLLLSFSCAFSAQSQISGSITVGTTTYPTLDSTIRLLNAAGIGSGGVTVNVPANYTETLTRPLSLITTGTSANPIVFQKTGSGANPLVTAYTTGTATASSAAPDGMWSLVGSDYVTINGIDLVDNSSNTTNATQMEYGYGLFRASATNGCQNNLIKNCTVTLNYNNNAAGTAPMVDGSVGILSINATISAATTSLTITSAAGANSNNQFYSNTIKNTNIGIALIGYADVSPYTYADAGNDVGGTALSTGNSILNFGGASSAANAAAGVRTLAQYGLNVSYNTINNNNGSGASHVATLRGIYANTANGASETINNNTITIVFGGTTAQVSCIENAAGSSGSGNTVSINNNTIQNSTNANNSSGTWYGIYSNSASAATLNINSNTFSSNTSATSSGNAYLIYNTGSATAINMNSNNLSFSFTNSSGNSGYFYGVYNGGGASNMVLNMNSNTFSNITYPNATGTGYMYYLYNGVSGSSTTFNANNWNNLNVNNNYYNYLCYNSTTQSSAVNFTNNTITTGYTRTSGAAASYFYCYYSLGSSGSGCTQTFSGNNFSNISAATSGSGTFYGIYNADGLSTPYPKKLIFNNTISNINYNTTSSFYGIYGSYIGEGPTTSGSAFYNNTVNNISTGATQYCIYAGSSAGSTYPNSMYNNTVYAITSASGAANGFYLYGAGAGLNFYKNKVYNVSQTGSSGTANGIYIIGGSLVNAYNNIVGDIKAPNTTSNIGVSGILVSGVSTANLSYNTVFINPTTTSTTTFGSSALYVSSTTPSVTLRNNILVDTGAVGSTGGYTAAFRYTSAPSTSNYTNTSNNNLFYAGTPSSSKLIYGESSGSSATNGKQTLAAYKSYISTRDQSSISENPPFSSTTGSTSNYLHINTAIATAIESGGTAVSGITDDYDGDVRYGNTGYSGSGTATDIGADEFSGTSPSPIINSVTASPLGNQCSATSRTITANVTPGSANLSAITLSYSLNGGTPTLVTMTGGSTSSTSNWTATIPAASPVNAIITYSVTATDGTYSKTSSVFTYQDAPLTGFTATATISQSRQCSGSSDTLRALLTSTAAAPTYANPPAVSNPTTDEDMGNVTFGALNNTSVYNSLSGTLGTATGTAGSYSDFSSFTPQTYILGSTYKISLSSLQATGSYSNVMAAFIDYNRNGTFDAGEQVFTSTAATSGAHTDSGFVTIPTTASLGNTRLRVLVTETSTLPTSATQSITWGEYEDYTINIAGAPSANTYTWVNSAATTVGTGSPLVINPTSNSSYSFTVMDPNGCTLNSSSVADTIIALPSAPTTTNSTQCGVGVPTASASGAGTGSTYNWYAAASGGARLQTGGSTYTGTIATTTTLYVAINNGTCESSRTPVTITVNTPNAITAATTTSPACANSTVALGVTKAAGSNVYVYTWTASPAAGSGIPTSLSGASQTVTPTIAGTYVYTVTGVDAVAGCTAQSSVTVSVGIPPPAPLVTPMSAQTFCLGGSQALTALPGTTIIFKDTFETFPLAQWSTSGTGVTFNQDANYFYQGASGLTMTYTTSAAAQLTQSSAINLSQYGNPVLTFYQICATEAGYDYGYVEYSTNGGTSWTSFPTSAYSGSGTLKNSVVSFDKSSYSDWGSQFTSSSSTPGSSPATSLWKKETISLASYATATNFKIRFRLTSDGSINYYGWMLDSVAISAQPSVTYSWTSTPAGFTAATQNATATPTIAGTYNYKATVTALNGCTASAVTANVVVNPLPTIGVTPATAAICIGNSISLTASGATTYSWSGTGLSATTGATVTATPATTGTASYTITGTDANSCMSTVTKNVTVNALPVISVSPSGPVVLCAGQSTTLTASGATTYSWSPATGLNTTTSATVTANPTTTQNYTVTGTDGNGCQNTASKTVTVNPLPVIVISPAGATAICTGQTVTLTASGATSYAWSPNTGLNTTTGSTVIAGPTATQTYSIQGTDANGCQSTVTKTVTVNGLPTITISPSTAPTICSGASVPLTASGGVTYSWTPASSLTPSTGATVNAAPATTQTYTVTGTDANGCQGTATRTVNVNPSPTVTISPSSPIAFCIGQNTSLTASGANSYVWTPATGLSSTTSATVTASPITTTTYTVTGTGSNGCTGQAIKVVTVNPLPTIVVNGSGSLCIGSSIPLSASGASTYTWTPSASLSSGTGSLVTASPTVATTYTVTGTDGNGCVNSTNKTVTVNALPTIAISPSGGAVVICAGSSTSLTASGGVSYNWTPSAGLSTTTAATVSASPTGTTTYTVTGTDGNGCQNTASKTVTVNALPIVTISPNTAAAVCSGAGATLTASGASTYTWTPTTGLTPSTGIGATVNASPSASTTYTVTGTDGNGCKNTASRLVTVLGLPTIVISPLTPVTICEGSSVTLTASGAATYSWTPSSSLSAATGTSVTASPIVTTTYTITGIAANGCQNSTTKTVSVSPKPSTTITPGGYVNVCGGDTVRLKGTSDPDYGYQWLLYGAPVAGGTDSILATVTGGFYTVRVTNLNTNCVGTTPTPVVITVTPRPVAVITAVGATMSAGSGYQSYQWMKNGVPIAGATSSTYTPTHDGYYSVMVTDTTALHCSGTSEVFHLTALGITTATPGETIRIYPNPAANVLHVDAPAGTTVTVTGMDGKLVFTGTDVHQVSIATWADGVYRVIVRDREGTYLKGEKVTKLTR